MFFDLDTKDMAEGEFSEAIIVENDILSVDTRGIFDETYEQIDPETGMSIMSKNPRVSLYSIDIEAAMGEIEECWFVTARGKKYRIKSPQKDGAGMIMLELKIA
jgi:hypothetical protein